MDPVTLQRAKNYTDNRATGLYIPDSTGNYASTPNHADLNITGDIQLDAFVIVPDYAATGATNNVVFAVDSGGGSTRAYSFGWRGDAGNEGRGRAVTWDSSGSAAQWFGGVFPDASEGLYLRWTIEFDTDGTFKTYYSENGVTYTQVGSDDVRAFTDIRSVSTPATVGSLGDGTNPAVSTIRHAVLRDGINGTIAAAPRFDVPMGDRYRDSTGKIWTMNGSGWAWALPDAPIL